MKLTYLAKRMIITILIISSVCVLFSVIYYRSMDFLPFMFGACLGSAASIAKVFMLESAIDKALAMEQKRAGVYIGAQHLLRFLLSGAALLLGALVPQISLWGVVVGILAYQIAIFNVKFTSKR